MRLHTKAALLGFLACAGASHAGVFLTFYNITNNGAPDVSAQLSCEVSAVGAQVSFKFTNNVGITSSITDVYFDDGTLLGIATISGSGGVVFASPANPENLPGGNTLTPAFQTTQNFSADASPPVTHNGVNAATEFLEIIFDLQSGQTYNDTIAALVDGSLRVGMKIQGFANGESEGYVNNPPETIVPLPSFASLGLAGLGMLAFRRRR